ncbi:amidohydrolase 2 [Mytilinidion resinicola]|uniref:Amidohydrolase 2 n=1 Tax=Mytilinidion resinicola TaxID=574789 RepID=A0A6A6YVY1_9PEZI|nr:amidohydrolase 2 [Mytilinidion resinicola]KAF2813102.1 amidohydrolase 2 [Mytilinidion resinicola]
MTQSSKSPVVDVHSHLYPNLYIDLLRDRTEVPCVRSNPDTNELRLVNRAGENGKPMTPLLYDISTKIAFMDEHGIDISVLSLGNPWLDFLPSETAGDVAKTINDSTNELCKTYPGRLFFFAALPLSAPTNVIVAEIFRLQAASHVRGIILGPGGLGEGLDDEKLVPVFQAAEEICMPVFLHPHHGLPSSVWGPCCGSYGQVPAVSLGFPMETTIGLVRMILAGIFEKVPNLQIIVSHAGGTLPFLAGRIESCIEHDRVLAAEGKLKSDRRTVWDILKNNLYLNSVIFDKIGLKAAIEASGVDRVMFGTDHPLFPPASVKTNVKAVGDTSGGTDEYDMIMGGNAARVLRLF